MVKNKTKSHKTHKTHEANEKKESHVSDKVSGNPIIGNIAFIAVAFLVVGLIVGALVSYGAFMMSGSGQVVTDSQGNNLSAGVVDEQALKLKVENYVNTNMLPDGVELTINDINQSEDGLYQLAYSIVQDGNVVQEGTIYSTGTKLVLGAVVDLDTTVEPAEPATPPANAKVSKEETPHVELYVWGYCPYGVQAQTPFADVAATLKDNANFDIVLYYDGHGAHETEQNKIQSCIQEIDKNKYWAYAAKFVRDIYPVCGPTRDVNCDLSMSTELMDSLGIDSTAVLDCVDTQGDALLAASSAKAQAAGVTGSPTLVVNGTKVTNVERTANGFLGAVCNGFITEPDACSTTLSDDASAAVGSC